MAWANTALTVEMALAWDTRQQCADGDAGECWLLVVIDGSKPNIEHAVADCSEPGMLLTQVCSSSLLDHSSFFLFSQRRFLEGRGLCGWPFDRKGFFYGARVSK